MTEPNADRLLDHGALETDVPVLIPAVGEQLRAAREQAGLQVKDVAQTLKLGQRQVDALENGDWASLPGATFIRGSVRNYARLVALDPVPLMAQLDAVVERPKTILALPQATSAQMPYAGGGTRRDRNVVLIGLVAVVLASLAYFLLPNDLDALRGDLQSIVDSLSRKEEPAPVQPVVASEPVFPPGTTPQQVMTPPSLQNDTTPASMAPVQDKVGKPASSAELEFVLSRDSWIEVRDRDDKVVFSQRLQVGAQQQVAGQGPLSVVIGYAPGVKLTWRGQVVDLEPHTRGDVARLVLE